MDIVKTKDAADLLSVSQTTIKRWVSTFPNLFPKDRSGHYIFSEQEINLLMYIKDRISHGETLDSIKLTDNQQPLKSLQDSSYPNPDKPLEEVLSRIVYIERSLDQKADEVVSVQLLKQREEIEELRQVVKQLAASIETIQKPSSKIHSLRDEVHPAASSRLQSPPRKRGLLRSFFSFL